MSATPAILFFHTGQFPRYLRRTMESARYFNPDARIILISDQQPDLGWIRGEVVLVSSLSHRLLPEFHRRYQHISGLKVKAEKLFLERWFHLDCLLEQEALSEAIYLDSDCALFASGRELFDLAPAGSPVCSKCGGPAVTFLRQRIEGFLEFILERYLDEPFLNEWRQRSNAAIARGGLDNLGDMVFLELYAARGRGGAIYPNDTPLGHIDHCINIADGMRIRRRRKGRVRKLIFWEIEGDTLVPYFETESGKRVRALAIHFQDRAKQLLGRFNPVSSSSAWPLTWRQAWFNRHQFWVS
ncbi:MAG: hypothetical protein OHK005_19950 [Candidatus Methylacidiphilales bacterium]